MAVRKKLKPFALIRPCAKCPFRTDIPGYLRGARAQEIAEALASGGDFPCHETTVTVEDEYGDDSERAANEDSKFCAGALIAMEKEGFANQHMRVGERIGLYDNSKLDMDAPVVRSLAAFVNHHSEGEEDECCEVSGSSCEAPAGMLVNGVVIPYVNDGVELHECPECGQMVCDSCSGEDGRCDYCRERE